MPDSAVHVRDNRVGEKLSFTVSEVIAATGFPRTSIFEFIKRGELRSFRHGKQRFVLGDSLRDLIDRLASREAA